MTATASFSANMNAAGRIAPGSAGSALGGAGTLALDWETGDATGAAAAGGAVASIVPGSAGKALGGAASGAAAGAAMGSVVPGFGTAVGAVAGGIVGFLSHIGGSSTPTTWHYDIITNDSYKRLILQGRGGEPLIDDARAKIKARFPRAADQAIVRAWLYDGGQGSVFEESVFDATMAIGKLGSGPKPARVTYNPFTDPPIAATIKRTEATVHAAIHMPPPIPPRAMADSVVHEFVNELLAYRGCPTSDQYLVAAHRALTKAQSEGPAVLALVQQKVSLVESVGLAANGLTAQINACRSAATARTTPRVVANPPAKSKSKMWWEIGGGAVGIVGVGLLAHKFMK